MLPKVCTHICGRAHTFVEPLCHTFLHRMEGGYNMGPINTLTLVNGDKISPCPRKPRGTR